MLMHHYTRTLKLFCLAILLCLLFQPAMAQKTPVSRLSSSDSIKIETLLSKMTLDEKLGQLSLFASDWDVTGPILNSCLLYTSDAADE